MPDQEAQEIPTQIVVISSRQKDAGAQGQGVTNDEWENNFRSTHWVYDAEFDTMETVDQNKQEANAQTIKAELRCQSRFPWLCGLSLGSRFILVRLRPHLPA